MPSVHKQGRQGQGADTGAHVYPGELVTVSKALSSEWASLTMNL